MLIIAETDSIEQDIQFLKLSYDKVEQKNSNFTYISSQ